MNIIKEALQADRTIHNNRELYDRQVRTLEIFLDRGAISRAQYDKSLRDLTEKMVMSA